MGFFVVMHILNFIFSFNFLKSVVSAIKILHQNTWYTGLKCCWQSNVRIIFTQTYEKSLKQWLSEFPSFPISCLSPKMISELAWYKENHLSNRSNSDGGRDGRTGCSVKCKLTTLTHTNARQLKSAPDSMSHGLFGWTNSRKQFKQLCCDLTRKILNKKWEKK